MVRWLGGSLAGLAAGLYGCRGRGVGVRCEASRCSASGAGMRVCVVRGVGRGRLGGVVVLPEKSRGVGILRLFLPSSARLRREFLAALLHSVLPRRQQSNSKHTTYTH